ncbi:hypothetical protein RvY_14858 [Ramazzottius varieornatus]|uniref:Uncharacterized protein n=1 Tax=Ramazzottius varieornatus TaxID=947166 RepID=A0A1D1VUH9_RAMVA|nr:hypothetical protein RvY_14858 [Ramazzottius varieornatus]
MKWVPVLAQAGCRRQPSPYSVAHPPSLHRKRHIGSRWKSKAYHLPIMEADSCDQPWVFEPHPQRPSSKKGLAKPFHRRNSCTFVTWTAGLLADGIPSAPGMSYEIGLISPIQKELSKARKVFLEQFFIAAGCERD